MSTLKNILSDEDEAEDITSEVTEETTETPEATEPDPEETPDQEVEPEADDAAPAEPAEDPAPRMVPYEAMREEREKRQELADRLARIEARQAPPAPAPVPDMFEDPEGYQRYQEQRLRNAQLDAFEESARDVHGDEVVDAAFSAFQSIRDTPEGAALANAKNPWRSVVQWHKKQEEMAKFNSEEWRQTEREKLRAEILAEVNAQRVVAPPPPSLAKGANLGNRTQPPVDDGDLSLDDILGNPSA